MVPITQSTPRPRHLALCDRYRRPLAAQSRTEQIVTVSV